jgi:hypothetical protein
MKNYDVIVVGGSIGGVLAAKKAAELGKRVLLIERTKWIGGQFTNQAVPPDEHPFIESFGSTSSYRQFRNDIRSYMKTHYPIKAHIKDVQNWNPGHASVSRLSAPPTVFLELFQTMLKPYLDQGLELLLEHEVSSADVSDHLIRSLVIKNLKDGNSFTAQATYFLDATDTGELLPLTSTDYRYGRESQAETGEPHTMLSQDPDDMQPVTWVAAIEYCPGEHHVIDRPKHYDFFKKEIWPCDTTPVLSFYGPDSSTGKTKKFGMFDGEGQGLFPLWSYRRIMDPRDFEAGFYPHEVTLLNWPQNDYIFGNLFENQDEKFHQEMAKDLTRSLIYWLQTEAVRPDGGIGYPGIRLRGDVLGTEDGLAMAPYIRESRRIIALKTITEHLMNANLQHELPHLDDSVGVGSYHIDLHMTTKSKRFFYFKTWPFQIPLGAMIPIHTKNLIPACKNIGTTQLTNGCYRLHPVEWNIGEVAGILAATSLNWNMSPKAIYLDKKKLQEFQKLLIQEGIELSWPKDKVHVI